MVVADAAGFLAEVMCLRDASAFGTEAASGGSSVRQQHGSFTCEDSLIPFLIGMFSDSLLHLSQAKR